MMAGIPEIYSKFNTWIDNHSQIAYLQSTNTPEQLEQNQEYQGLANSTPSIFNIENEGVTKFFNGMEKAFGADKKEESIFDKAANFVNGMFYNSNINKLGKGELLEKDSDESGELSLEEYINAELADLGENATIEEKAYVSAYSQMLFQILDEGTSDSDKNGQLSAKELASYYKTVDRFENGELKDKGNGSFNVDDAASVKLFLAENMVGERAIFQAYGDYCEKYMLEEMQ